MSLFTLNQEQEQLLNNLEQFTNTETGEISDEYFSLMEETENKITEKADNIGTLHSFLSSDVSAIKQEIDRLSKLKSTKEKRIESIENYAKYVMQKFGLERLDGKLHAFSFRKSEQTILDNEELIPEQFKKEKTVVTVSIDKNEIKKAIKAGEVVPGARILEVKNLTVK